MYAFVTTDGRRRGGGASCPRPGCGHTDKAGRVHPEDGDRDVGEGLAAPPRAAPARLCQRFRRQHDRRGAGRPDAGGAGALDVTADRRHHRRRDHRATHRAAVHRGRKGRVDPPRSSSGARLDRRPPAARGGTSEISARCSRLAASSPIRSEPRGRLGAGANRQSRGDLPRPPGRASRHRRISKRWAISPTAHAVYVVKLGYLHPQLEPIAARHILLVSEGAVPLDPRKSTWRAIRRPMYPLDEGHGLVAGRGGLT